jgi:CHAT domain-containing protein/tetratricopeptide (TPR) repeat protein
MRRRVASVVAVWTLLAMTGPAVVHGADLEQVGDEAVIGTNQTGETCRVRFIAAARERQGDRFSILCDGWTAPSGDLRRISAGRAWPPERLLTDSPWAKGVIDARLAGCGPVENTAVLDGVAAGLRPCTRAEGGWPVVLLAAHVGRRAYLLETFPTNARVLERAVAVLEGKESAAPRQGGKLSAAIRRAETLVGADGKLVGVQDMGAADTLHRLGKLHFRSGNYPAAEQTFRRLLELQERLLGRDDPNTGLTLGEIGLNVGVLRRPAESDALFARAEALAQQSLSVDHYPIVVTYRAFHELTRGRPDAALPIAQQAAEQAERRRPGGNGVAHSTLAVARAFWELKRLDEAAGAARKVVHLLQGPGNDPEWRQWWAGEAHQLLGVVYRDQKKWAEARTELTRALERREAMFGRTSRVVESLITLGRTERMAGDLPAALAFYRRAAAIQAEHRVARDQTRQSLVVPYLEALAAQGQAVPAERDALAAEAFVAMQLPRSGETARALQAMAVRVASGDARLADVVRQLQDATRRRDGARVALAVESARPDRDAAREGTLQSQLREGDGRIEALESQLQAEFPRYARLTRERPVPVADVAAVLRPDEALVSFVTAGEATFVVLVREGTATLHAAHYGTAALTADVQAVRKSLAPAGGQIPALDAAAARRVHRALLAPLAGRLSGVRHLVAVPTGPLLSLPLGVLLTRDVEGPIADYASLPWLTRDMAVSVLPSVAALRDLRGVKASAAARPFLGFGDPVLASGTADRRSLVTATEQCGPDGAPDLGALRALPSLPETADELKRIARALGSDDSAVVLGTAATEARVRASDLRQYRVLAFATHGLLPGELACQPEPALILTPPAAASAADDGLLRASEVTQLGLDADWVLLSACNTAGPDGSLAGEGLSGLARAFFYAGARALLVSHWAVASEPTVHLTTGIFDGLAREPGLGRAEALRRSQLALLGRAETAHPFFWAPFVLVGDGGRPVP